MQEPQYDSFSDLWKGEQGIISEIASLVPDGGTIVEIGTFKGGTAQLLHFTTRKRNVKTHTVDIEPHPIAYENLKDTDVEIIAKPSLEAARMWVNYPGKTIDLLFIDGSHKFQDVFEDFNSWVHFLKPGGTIVFHDYDPIERGGLVHLGVKICVDTVLRNKFISGYRHKYRLLWGIVEFPDKVKLNMGDCRKTFTELGNKILRLYESDYSGWTLVVDDKFAVLLKKCLKLHNCGGPVPPAEVADPRKKYLVSAHPLGTPLDLLRAQNIPDSAITVIDSLQACYIIGYALEKNYNHLLALSSNKTEFTHWVETLFVFEDAIGRFSFSDGTQLLVDGTNDHELLQLIAQEQVRLTILARILRTFVDWRP